MCVASVDWIWMSRSTVEEGSDARGGVPLRLLTNKEPSHTRTLADKQPASSSRAYDCDENEAYNMPDETSSPNPMIGPDNAKRLHVTGTWNGLQAGTTNRTAATQDQKNLNSSRPDQIQKEKTRQSTQATHTPTAATTPEANRTSRRHIEIDVWKTDIKPAHQTLREKQLKHKEPQPSNNPI
ncbi:hypothetical protein U1Q18_042041 [Sarracenia purpurea var. burkii]